MIDSKIQDRFWALAAISILLATLITQTIYRFNAQPQDWLKNLPTGVGDVFALVIWLGGGPLVVAFLFLIPIASSKLTFKVAIFLVLIMCTLIPIGNYMHFLRTSGGELKIKTIVLNAISLAALSIPIFFTLVCIPQLAIKFLKRRN